MDKILHTFAEADKHDFDQKTQRPFVPMKLPPPLLHGDDSTEDITEEDEEDTPNVPFYPTIDGKPPKVPQEKPHKKQNKENKKNTNNGLNNNIFLPTAGHDNKYNFNTNNNYDDEKIPSHVPQLPTHPQQNSGPGFFNPGASKDHYPEYPNFNHPEQQHPIDKQLFNILGPNSQNVPPHVRIDQLLQHIQSQDSNAGPSLHGANINLPFQPSQQNGINYNQFGSAGPSQGVSNRPG